MFSPVVKSGPVVRKTTHIFWVSEIIIIKGNTRRRYMKMGTVYNYEFYQIHQNSRISPIFATDSYVTLMAQTSRSDRSPLIVNPCTDDARFTPLTDLVFQSTVPLGINIIVYLYWELGAAGGCRARPMLFITVKMAFPRIQRERHERDKREHDKNLHRSRIAMAEEYVPQVDEQYGFFDFHGRIGTPPLYHCSLMGEIARLGKSRFRPPACFNKKRPSNCSGAWADKYIFDFSPTHDLSLLYIKII